MVPKKIFQRASVVMGFVFFSMSSCDNGDFFKFDNSDISYQIYAGKKDIVRIVRRNENGPYSLQLFDQHADLVKDVTMATPFPFEFTKCQNDTLTISYFVGKSDLRLFLPWFKSNKFNPQKIGTYKITYAYAIEKGDFSDTTKIIDSIYLAKNIRKTRLYVRNQLVDEVPIEFFYVYRNGFSYFKNRTLIKYHLTDTTLVRQYLADITSLYK